MRNEDDMHAAAELAELSDNKVSQDVLDDTAYFKKLLYTGEVNDFATDPSVWGRHLYTAEKFGSNNIYYYTFIKENWFLEKREGKVFSLKSFLQSI